MISNLGRYRETVWTYYCVHWWSCLDRLWPWSCKSQGPLEGPELLLASGLQTWPGELPSCTGPGGWLHDYDSQRLSSGACLSPFSSDLPFAVLVHRDWLLWPESWSSASWRRNLVPGDRPVEWLLVHWVSQQVAGTVCVCVCGVRVLSS